MNDSQLDIIERFADWLDGHDVTAPSKQEAMQAIRAAVCELRIIYASRTAAQAA